MFEFLDETYNLSTHFKHSILQFPGKYYAIYILYIKLYRNRRVRKLLIFLLLFIFCKSNCTFHFIDLFGGKPEISYFQFTNFYSFLWFDSVFASRLIFRCPSYDSSFSSLFSFFLKTIYSKAIRVFSFRNFYSQKQKGTNTGTDFNDWDWKCIIIFVAKSDVSVFSNWTLYNRI